MNSALKTLRQLSPAKKMALYFVGALIGIVVGAFLTFQIFFLIKVIPHGGIL
jgi:hypothetical protein